MAIVLSSCNVRCNDCVWEWRGVRWHTDSSIHHRELLNTATPQNRTCKEWMMLSRPPHLTLLPSRLGTFILVSQSLLSGPYFHKIWTLYLKLFHTTPIIYRTFFSGKFSRSHSVTLLCPGYFKLYFIPHLSRLENVTSPGQAGYKIGWIFFEWWISWYIILFLIILLIISL